MTHPANTGFERELNARTVDSQKKEAFRKFREKQPLGSEDRAEADRLWAECERLGDAEIGKNRPVPRMTSAKPAAQRSGHDRHRGGDRRGPPNQGERRPHPNRDGRGDGRGGYPPPRREDTNNAGGADARVLGEPFHNPYTFLPFPSKEWFSDQRERREFTPLTQDEIELDRLTGVVELEIVTLSPLLTSDPKEASEHNGHRTFRALTVGNDVIVPATGVRGSLRTLMTILAGGTLGYLDDGAWLVQGRDLPLGPAGRLSPPSVPKKCFLARVAIPGTERRPGKVQLGQTRLVRVEDLERLRRPLPRPRPGDRIPELWVDDSVSSTSHSRDGKHRWQVKLSGRPVNPKGKREGLFLDDGAELELKPEYWRAYMGRNRHGDRPELKPGDLVWLEAGEGLTEIKSASDVHSIQWARWGRRGESLEKVICDHHGHLLPDSFNSDGKVDEITNLFGQVPADKKARRGAGPFAARVRPDNLVFRDAAKDGLLAGVVLAPLAPPHPGCAAFYRDETDPDRVTNAGKPLRGYKVYRTTTERDKAAPWRFDVQGVHGNDGRLKDSRQKVNKTCDLLDEGRVGTVRLSYRSLTKRELGLLLLACSVDWRLGGGKPLGLGHCRVRKVVVRDEAGLNEVARMHRETDAPAELPEPYAMEVADLLERRNLWHQSQCGVPKLRYPRAVDENRNGKARGGHTWFSRHSNPKKSAEADRPPVGLEVLWATDELQARAEKNRIKAQPLPRFDAEDPLSDVLHGYELFSGDGPAWSEQGRDRRTYHKKLEPFDEQKHARSSDKSGGSQGQSGKTRRDDRGQRRGR